MKVGAKLLVYLRNKIYKWDDGTYGLKEAIFFPIGIDTYIRYSEVLRALKNVTLEVENEKILVLEVGSGGEGLGGFLKYSGEHEKYGVILSDVDKNKVKDIKLGMPIVADGHYLPFRDNIFDVIIAIDVIEHIPNEGRNKLLEELKRVTKNAVLLHFIMHEPDKGFLGKEGDQKFQELYTKTFGKPEPNTAEHLKSGYPNLTEIREVFLNATIKGTQNVDVWLKYMAMTYKPIIRLFTGLMYFLRWKGKDGIPPFHGCFLEFNKYPNPTPDVVIVDLDYTLVKTNTTFDFMRFVRPTRYSILSKFLRPLLLLNRIFKRDLYKRILVMLCIGGISRETLEQYAKVYVKELEKNQNYNKNILSFLGDNHIRGILLSASLEVLVKNFKELGFDLTIGSKMHYKNDRFFWFSDLYNKKHTKIKPLLEHYDGLVIIDDSPEQEFYLMGSKVAILSPEDVNDGIFD